MAEVYEEADDPAGDGDFGALIGEDEEGAEEWKARLALV